MNFLYPILDNVCHMYNTYSCHCSWDSWCVTESNNRACVVYRYRIDSEHVIHSGHRQWIIERMETFSLSELSAKSCLKSSIYCIVFIISTRLGGVVLGGVMRVAGGGGKVARWAEVAEVAISWGHFILHTGLPRLPATSSWQRNFAVIFAIFGEGIY